MTKLGAAPGSKLSELELGPFRKRGKKDKTRKKAQKKRNKRFET